MFMPVRLLMSSRCHVIILRLGLAASVLLGTAALIDPARVSAQDRTAGGQAAPGAPETSPRLKALLEEMQRAAQQPEPNRPPPPNGLPPEFRAATPPGEPIE